MRENVISKNLKILLVCPGHQFGTVERRALLDCEYLRDIGGSPTLYCSRDSLLDKEADKLSLPRLFSRGVKKNKFFKYSDFFYLRSIIHDGEYDVIHCYDLNSLWIISFWLLSKPKIPLFYTFNTFEKNIHYSYIKSWLIKRVDKVLTFSQSTKNLAYTELGVPMHKVQVVGMGIENNFFYKERSLSEKVIGTYICDNQEFDNLRTILFALKPLKEKVKDLNLDLKLFIYTSKPIKDYYLYTDISRYIKELDLKSDIVFCEIQSFSQIPQESDLFISNAFHEPTNDMEVLNLLSGIPSIMPRTSARQDFVGKYKGIAETYYFQDARELRVKLLSILLNNNKYLEMIIENKDELYESHSIDNYTFKVHTEYERAVKKRIRFNIGLEKSS